MPALRPLAALTGAAVFCTFAAMVASAQAPPPATPAAKAATVPPVAKKPPGGAPVIAAAPAAMHAVTVSITKVLILDKVDQLSKGDIFARVIIGGKSATVPPVKQSTSFAPNWTFTQSVLPGRVPVRVELFDKDLTRDEPIDINRIDNKRAQDFVVDTRTCVVTGFAGRTMCGDAITRAGQENKKAEITFSVSVKK